MQPHVFTYDELTPLEQCIIDFMARQEGPRKPRKILGKRPQQPSVPKMPHTGE